MLFRPLFLLFVAASAMLAQSPAILEVEVNQAIGKQLNGALDFVAGKDTAIRAFLASEATVNPATTKLVVERAGTVVTELQAVTYTKPVSIVEFLCPTRAACGNWQAASTNSPQPSMASLSPPPPPSISRNANRCASWCVR
jgi:hypothetical protein